MPQGSILGLLLSVILFNDVDEICGLISQVVIFMSSKIQEELEWLEKYFYNNELISASMIFVASKHLSKHPKLKSQSHHLVYTWGVSSIPTCE